MSTLSFQSRQDNKQEIYWSSYLITDHWYDCPNLMIGDRVHLTQYTNEKIITMINARPDLGIQFETNESPDIPSEKWYNVFINCHVVMRKHYLSAKKNENDWVAAGESLIILEPDTDQDETTLRFMAEYDPPSWTQWLEPPARGGWFEDGETHTALSGSIDSTKDQAQQHAGDEDWGRAFQLIRNLIRLFPETKTLTLEQFEYVVHQAQARHSESVNVEMLVEATRHFLDMNKQ